MRYWFIRIQGRMSSIEAPVVPRRLASSAPRNRKSGVLERRRLALHVDVNAARDDVQGPDQRDEAHILVPDMQHPLDRRAGRTGNRRA